MTGAQIISIGGLTAAFIQLLGFPRSAGAVMVVANVLCFLAERRNKKLDVSETVK